MKSLVWVLDWPLYHENGDFPLVLGLRGQFTGCYKYDDHANAKMPSQSLKIRFLKILKMLT